jgi:hypothetical protein
MLIPIQSDGNCFFRCVASYLNEDIKTANRNENGRINNKYLRDKETTFSKFLRFSCVNIIETEKNKYDDTIYFDDEIYESIEERINNMYKNNELIGRLEMQIISKMYKINFNLFVLNKDKYNLVNRIGSILYRKCNLLLHENHYSLIDDEIDINEELTLSINRPDTPRFILNERQNTFFPTFQNTDAEPTPPRIEETNEYFDFVENKSQSVPPLSALSPPPPPIPTRPKSYNIPPPLFIVSPNVSPIQEEILPEIKSYIDSNISMAKIELLDVIKREMNCNNKILEQIEISSNISKNLQELIEKLYKNN